MVKKKHKLHQTSQATYSDPDYDTYVENLNREAVKESQKEEKADAKASRQSAANIPDDSEAARIQDALRQRASRRLMSLDALRGLNMLCIIGLATLITCICNLEISDFRVLGDGAVRAATAFRQSWPGPSPETIAKHMTHVQWNGVLHHDTIFPLFLFLAGVSFPFSFRKQRANGRPMWRVILKAIWRGLALVFLGIIYSNKVNFDFAHLRYMGVLQHIGLAWMFAVFIYLIFSKHTKTLIGVCATILISYWLVVALVPAPDVAPKEAFSGAAFASRAKDLFKVQAPYGLTQDEQEVVDAAKEAVETAEAEGASVAEAVESAVEDAEKESVAKRPVKHVPVFENNELPAFDAPDYPEIGTVAHNLLPEGCIVNYIDRKLVPGKLYHQPSSVERRLSTGKLYRIEGKGDERVETEITEYDPKLYRDLRDPEGLASTWPAIVTALLGMMFGGVLCRENEMCSKWRKLLILLLGGVVLMAIGYAWHMVFPINKNLWNSSFVCFVGGYSAIALGIFYLFIDIFRLRWLGFPFAVVGMNSITIFLAKRIVVFSNMRDFFFADAIDRFVPAARTIVDESGAETVIETGAFTEIATVVAGLIVSWCFLLWLYRHRIFMRV